LVIDNVPAPNAMNAKKTKADFAVNA
jgi:hypothetical protein